ATFCRAPASILHRPPSGPRGCCLPWAGAAARARRGARGDAGGPNERLARQAAPNARPRAAGFSRERAAFSSRNLHVKLRQLEYIVTIADNDLNITEAADRLATCQPGISKQLKLLEEEL